jgi:hypothetical protein
MGFIFRGCGLDPPEYDLVHQKQNFLDDKEALRAMARLFIRQLNMPTDRPAARQSVSPGCNLTYSLRVSKLNGPVRQNLPCPSLPKRGDPSLW